jgi:hypothetical protein
MQLLGIVVLKNHGSGGNSRAATALLKVASQLIEAQLEIDGQIPFLQEEQIGSAGMKGGEKRIMGATADRFHRSKKMASGNIVKVKQMGKTSLEKVAAKGKQKGGQLGEKATAGEGKGEGSEGGGGWRIRVVIQSTVQQQQVGPLDEGQGGGEERRQVAITAGIRGTGTGSVKLEIAQIAEKENRRTQR